MAAGKVAEIKLACLINQPLISTQYCFFYEKNVFNLRFDLAGSAGVHTKSTPRRGAMASIPRPEQLRCGGQPEATDPDRPGNEPTLESGSAVGPFLAVRLG